jgi:glutamyl-tRNA(Gln) amidotransferase subunit E
MADRARFWGRVGGIFHTDEMPAYGVTTEEIEELRKAVKARPEDAVVFVADSLENARDALKAVVERAREALLGVPEETRAPNPDGTTRYMRPRPGAARMYPETDIPPTQITEELINKISSDLPELPEQKTERLMKECKLNQKLARQIMDSEHGELFENIIRQSDVSPTTVAVFLTETLKSLKRDGLQVDRVSDDQIKEIFKSLSSGEVTKESLQDIVSWLSKNDGKTVKDAVESLGLKAVSSEELDKTVERLIAANKGLVEERGLNALGPLMGMVMKEMRGKVNPAVANELIKRKIEQATRK